MVFINKQNVSKAEIGILWVVKVICLATKCKTIIFAVFLTKTNVIVNTFAFPKI